LEKLKFKATVKAGDCGIRDRGKIYARNFEGRLQLSRAIAAVHRNKAFTTRIVLLYVRDFSRVKASEEVTRNDLSQLFTCFAKQTSTVTCGYV
jgi:hypothetical protein